MATKLVTLLHEAIGHGCLGKAADDEPVFVLRAHDLVAPGVVEAWCDQAVAAAKDKGIDLWDSPKIADARKIAAEMRAWQRVNGCKLPD